MVKDKYIKMPEGAAPMQSCVRLLNKIKFPANNKAALIIDGYKYSYQHFINELIENLGAKINTELESLAYVSGVLLGDGCQYYHKKGMYHTILVCKDLDFIEFFKNQIETWHTNKKYKIGQTKRGNRVYYRYTVSSKELYYRFKQAKSDLNWINTNETKIAFLQGIFDSEGGFGTRHIKIQMSNLIIIYLICKYLNDLHLPYHILPVYQPNYPNAKKQYGIYVCNKKYIIKFLAIIGFRIKRKVLSALNYLFDSIRLQDKDNLNALKNKLDERGYMVDI